MSSRTPSDDFTPDLGSSYLMPNYEYDLDYNEGVLEEGRLPEAYGLAELPDGVVHGSEEENYPVPEGVVMDEAEGFDLGELGVVAYSGLPQPETQEITDAREDNVPDIVDFSWLADATQDPERLPSLDTNKVIPELQEYWGARTDGITRIEARDLSDVRAHEAAEDDTPKWRFTNEQLRAVLAGAMRRSAMGIPIKQIKEEVVRLLGHEASRLTKPMKALENEHGLVGNVYIRASAYPGLLKGKWAKHIRKTHKRARYLIACGECDACKCGDHGSCACNAKLGLKAVKKVDWNKAYKHYAKMLEATGRLDRKATIMDKRIALRDAFLRRESAPDLAVEPVFPTHKAPSQRVSAKEAQRALKSLAPVEREILTNDALTMKAKRKKVRQRLSHLVKANLLSQGEAKKLLASKDQPNAILKRARGIIASRKNEGEYRGDGRLPKMASDEEALEGLTDLRKKAQSQREAQGAMREVKKALDGENLLQVKQMVRWTRQQMSEGMAGRDLTDLMAGRWNEKLIKAASSQLVQIRKKHEGLSGHLYVDAAAYASPKGVAGCEKAAPKHRANSIPTVLEMPRCGSCTARSQDEDGNTFCQKYNKPLVDAPPVEDPRSFQAEQIRLANAHDSEVTASLFQDPSGEFGLRNDSLDDFDVSTTPETDKVSDFTFGGMEWDE